MHLISYDSGEVPDYVLTDCSKLFSENYGHQNYRNIKLSSKQLLRYIINGYIICAYIHGCIVGYVCISNFTYNGCGISWITQLVVDKNYSRRGIGSALVNSIYGSYIGINSVNITSINMVKKLGEVDHKLLDNISYVLKYCAVSYLHVDSSDYHDAKLLHTGLILDESPIDIVGCEYVTVVERY